MRNIRTLKLQERELIEAALDRLEDFRRQLLGKFETPK
jgi:hypothetical protein